MQVYKGWTTIQPIGDTSGTYRHHVPNVSVGASGRGIIGSEVVRIGSEVVIDTFRSGGVIRSEPICTLFRNTHRYVPRHPSIRPEPIETTFRTYRDYVPNLSTTISERIDTHLGTYRWVVRNVSTPTSELLRRYSGTTRWVFRNYSMGISEQGPGQFWRSWGGVKHPPSLQGQVG